MLVLSTSENQFHSPTCRSIGTMGLQTSICSPFDIPNSLKECIIVLGIWFLNTVTIQFFFLFFFFENEHTSRFFFSRSAIVCIVTIIILCDVSKKCLVNAL